MKARLRNWFLPESPEIMEVILKDARAAGLYICLIGALQYPRWVYNDFSNHIYPGAFLQLAAVLACFVGAFAMRKPLTPASRHVFNAANIALVLIQVEVRLFAPDVPFSYLFPWITFPIIVILDTILFQGSPLYFCAAWLSVLGFYEMRIFFHESAAGLDSNAVAALQWGAAGLILGCCILNVLWFRFRYNNAAQKKEIQRLHEIALKDVELRADAEMKLALAEERERVINDFHSHLGGSLTDIQIYLMRQKRSNSQVEDWSELEKMLLLIVERMKNMIQDQHAATYLDMNFVLAVRSLLVRRYVNGGRMFRFNADDEARQTLESGLTNSNRQSLLSVIQEILNNDLKYGKGEASWEFIHLENNLKMQFRTQTTAKDTGTGFGRKILEDRCAEMGASMLSEEKDGYLEIKIAIPAA